MRLKSSTVEKKFCIGSLVTVNEITDLGDFNKNTPVFKSSDLIDGNNIGIVMSNVNKLPDDTTTSPASWIVILVKGKIGWLYPFEVDEI